MVSTTWSLDQPHRDRPKWRDQCRKDHIPSGEARPTGLRDRNRDAGGCALPEPRSACFGLREQRVLRLCQRAQRGSGTAREFRPSDLDILRAKFDIQPLFVADHDGCDLPGAVDRGDRDQRIVLIGAAVDMPPMSDRSYILENGTRDSCRNDTGSGSCGPRRKRGHSHFAGTARTMRRKKRMSKMPVSKTRCLFL